MEAEPAELNLLLFDLDRAYQTILGPQLKNLGIGEVFGVSELDGAVHAFKLHRIDVVVVEFYPPFIRHLRNREHSENPKIPIVVLSEVNNKDEIFEARDIGVNEFVSKPTSPDVLMTHILSAATDERPFIEMDNFFGPDRRRHHDTWSYKGPERRN